MDKIIVVLKVRDRGNLYFHLKHLNYWLSIFNDKSKYDVYIYSENLKLPEQYNSYKIINKNFYSTKDCKNWLNIVNSKFPQRWRGAAFAHGAMYFYFNNKIIYNIDADDISLFGKNTREHFVNLENILIKDNLPVLSWDLHFSHPIADVVREYREHHWTFGITLANSDKFKDIIYESTLLNLPDPQWEKNLDYTVDCYLDRVEHKIAFLFNKHNFVHNYTVPCKHIATIDGELFKTKLIDGNGNQMNSTQPIHQKTQLISI